MFTFRKNFLVFFCDSLLIWIIPLSIPDKNICDLYMIVELFIKLYFSDIESTQQWMYQRILSKILT